MKKLTSKQENLLMAINWYIDEYGYPPTINELAEMLESDNKAVFEKLLILEKKGYITVAKSKARSIKVIKGINQ